MKNKSKPYLLILPASILLIGIMSIGMINAILQSLGYFPMLGKENITLYYYKEILSNEIFLKSLIFSLKTSFISSTISVLLGVLLAYLLCQSRYSKFRNSILTLPIVVPHIVVVLLMIALFSQTGMVSRVFYHLNIIDDSSKFKLVLSDSRGIGIILVYIWKGIPFTAMTTYNIMRNINDNLEKVAINLGASKFQSFRYIILPISTPSIISSFIILFAFSFGSYEVPFLIGPTSPKALPVQAYISYTSSDLSQRANSMVINVVLSCISFVLLIVYNKIFEKINKYKYR